MDEAVRDGNLERLKFLHFNRTEGCTKTAMDDAAKNGHLEVIKFLHERHWFRTQLQNKNTRSFNALQKIKSLFKKKKIK